MTYAFLPEILERWKADWIDPALGLVDGLRGKSDSHLNSVSIEYPESEVTAATRNYDPSCLLGSGTFGSVYKGTMKDGTEVAIKVLQIPEEAGFEEEVQVLSRFRHPNLVILMGFARHAATGGRSLIYEYLAGGDVSKRLQRSRQRTEIFDARLRLSVALDAASGLSHLHNATPRAFHRDIKGPNIILDRNGTGKIADFGLACVSQGSQHKVQQASGTVGYACPEYIRSGVITEGSEVHSFGMVLLELLTGAPPAVQRPDKPKEFFYLVDHLQGSLSKVMEMLDETAHFSVGLARSLAELAFHCITARVDDRPLFVQLVEILRRLLEQHYGNVRSFPIGTINAMSGPGLSSVKQEELKLSDTAPDDSEHVASPTAPVGVATVAAGDPAFHATNAPTGCDSRAAAQEQQEQQPQSQQPQQPQPQQQAHHQAWQKPQQPQPQQCPPLPPVPQVPPPVVSMQHHQPQHDAQSAQIKQQQQQQQHHQQYAPNHKQQWQQPHLPQPTPSAGNPRDQRSLSLKMSPPAAGIAATTGPVWPSPAPVPAPHSAGNVHYPPPHHPVAPAPAGSCPDAEVLSGHYASRLCCVYATDIDLSALSDAQRFINFPLAEANELVVGRNAQPASFWEALIQDRRLRGTISREHFKISQKVVQHDQQQMQQQQQHPGIAGFWPAASSYYITCLSLNGLLLNGNFIRQGSVERRLQHGDLIALAATMEASDGATPPPPRTPFLVFGFELLSSGQ